MPLPEQLVEHGADQHLIGGGGAETAALGDSGGHVDIQALARQIAAQLAHAGGYAPDQRRGGVDLLRLRRQLAERHLRHGVALRQHADNAAVVGRRRRQNVQIHGGCQHTAVLMVRVVAADLRAAGCGEYEAGLRAKLICKSLLERFVHRNDAPFCDFFLFAFYYRYLYFREICCGCNGIFKR